jgi:CHASE3 domain-containing protein
MLGAIGLGPARPGVRLWLLGKRSAFQFASIVVLALVSFALSAFVGERNWNARSWVGHTRDVQTAIDRIVWDLMSLQQAMQAQRLTHDPEQVVRFKHIRGDVEADLGQLARLAADNSHQQRLIAELDGVLAQYLAKIDRIAVSDRGAGLPAAFDPGASKGMGMQVAALLVRQLRGTLGIDRAWAGARFIVTVPITAASAGA